MSEEVPYETLSYLSLNLSLAEWQKSELSEIDSTAGAHCLLKMWLNFSNSERDLETVCNSNWDYVYCWPPTHVGTVISKPCTEIFKESHPDYAAHLTGNAVRECKNNGTWVPEVQANYDECERSFQLYIKEIEEENVLVPMVHYMLFTGSIFSLLCLGASLAIFYNFRSVWCDRVTVHVHLMLALILRFILMFIITEPFVFKHASSYRDVSILCEIILVLFLYSTFASVSWMFNQGLYLNITLMAGVVRMDSRYHLKVYYIIGWVVPLVFLFAYVFVMLLKSQEKCWKGYSEMREMWILLGPVMFELVINGIFLLNILRILLRKVRNSNSRPDSSQLKAAAKATAFLFPVLGINNLILLYNPGGEYNKYFVTLNTFFGSTQGICVAIVYCFSNKEVLAAIHRSLQRAKARRMGNGSRGLTSEHQQRHVSAGILMAMSTIYGRETDQYNTARLDHPV